METKTCSHPDCKNENPQPIDNFWHDKASSDGHQRWCKDCYRAYRKSPRGQAVQRKYRLSDKNKANQKRYARSKLGRETKRQYKKQYRKTKNGREQHCAEVKRHREKYPNRTRARKTITAAIARGDIPSASELKCAHCGDDASEYHHHNYAKKNWLDVIPLCNRCHNLIHNPPKSYRVQA